MPSASKLFITIVGAKHLIADTDVVDSFVELHCGSMAAKTRVAKNSGTTPEWNQKLTLALTGSIGECDLLFIVKNVNSAKSGCGTNLGFAKMEMLSLVQSLMSSTKELKLPLSLISKDGQGRGQLFLSIKSVMHCLILKVSGAEMRTKDQLAIQERIEAEAAEALRLQKVKETEERAAKKRKARAAKRGKGKKGDKDKKDEDAEREKRKKEKERKEKKDAQNALGAGVRWGEGMQFLDPGPNDHMFCVVGVSCSRFKPGIRVLLFFTVFHPFDCFSLLS